MEDKIKSQRDSPLQFIPPSRQASGQQDSRTMGKEAGSAQKEAGSGRMRRCSGSQAPKAHVSQAGARCAHGAHMPSVAFTRGFSADPVNKQGMKGNSRGLEMPAAMDESSAEAGWGGRAREFTEPTGIGRETAAAFSLPIKEVTGNNRLLHMSSDPVSHSVL